MYTNNKIRSYLASRRQLAINRFESDHPLLQQQMNALLALDLAEQRLKNETELSKHASEWWPVTKEPIDGILFEYDYYIGGEADAAAYGIPFGDFRSDQVEPYGFGGYYDFAPKFEAVYGVILHSMEISIEFNDLNLYKADNSINYELSTAYKLLQEAHKLTAFLVLHDALANFTKTAEYQKLNRLDPFHFVIQEHDVGYTYPLYVAFENA